MVKRKRFCASARLQFMFNANYKCHLCKCVLPPSFELDEGKSNGEGEGKEDKN